MKINDSDKCSFCKVEKETIIHLFWECNSIKPFILEALEYIKGFDSTFIIDNSKTFILGFSERNLFHFNIICLEIKRFIYLCKRKGVNPTLQGLKGSLKLASSIVCQSKMNEVKIKYQVLLKTVTGMMQ